MSQVTRPRVARTAQIRPKGLVVQDGEIGVIRGGEFESHTNFTIEILHAVRSPEKAPLRMLGFVYKIRSTDGVER